MMPLTDAAGNILQWFGTNTDVTDRKRAEEMLRESEAQRAVTKAVDTERGQLLNILETLPMMICLLTPDYHVAFANRSFRQKYMESGEDAVMIIVLDAQSRVSSVNHIKYLKLEVPLLGGQQPRRKYY